MAYQTATTPVHLMTHYSLDGKFISMEKTKGAIKQSRYYSDVEKAHAAALYAVVKSLTEVEKVTGISIKALSKWKQEPWFEEIVERVKVEQNEILDAKFSKVLDKAADQMEERIDNGDFQVLKDGSTVRVPMRARDLAVVAGTLFDRRQLLRGEATSLSAPVNAEVKLKELWAKFESFNKAREITQDAGTTGSTPDVPGANEAGPGEV